MRIHVDTDQNIHAAGNIWRRGSTLPVPGMVSEAEAADYVARGWASWVQDAPAPKPVIINAITDADLTAYRAPAPEPELEQDHEEQQEETPARKRGRPRKAGG